MSVSHHESSELIKVAVLGLAGAATSWTLTDVATIVSILVGLATLTYIVAKTFFLFRNHGKPPAE